MGWTVLYIAFGVVALWLLGEVLLQYKARLRWRLLAFGGFLLVVLGVLLPSVLVIVAGAVAFAVGQTYVTLSFRRGFSTGWAIGGSPGASRRRKAAPQAEAGPTLEVTELSYDTVDGAYGTEDGPGHDGHPETAAETTAVYEPEPMPDDTGQYGIYDTTGQHTDAGYGTGYDPYASAYQQPGYEQSSYEQPAYQQQPAYDYGAAAGQQQYAAYSDPYIGPGTDGQQYGSYYGDPYAPSYAYDTPPGGVWVPQQRDTEPAPQQPQAPYGYEQQPHPDDQQQYRY
ncbi:hypothetical protein GCM10010222_28830 [Streptomyces tanashiensis]|uniref:hypothetical protein n=1 Tax=Streptomyces tanashiensis TaxID=67367 RepID=UPI0016775C9E|nr:hypothetical protein [Streptomyces tanashiensis]GGS85393.1 hypothetical protein GCM10010222_28830 [Streptomyces tanashiensis]